MKKRESAQFSGPKNQRIAVGSFKQERWELPVKVRIGKIEVSETAGIVSRRIGFTGSVRDQVSLAGAAF